MVHPVASAGHLRSIQCLSAMDKAQVVLPGGIETTKINAREGVPLLAGVEKGEEDSLLLVERDRLRRGIFAVLRRRDEPVKRPALECLTNPTARGDPLR